MAFSSWLRHEEMRAEEFKKYKEEEQQTPLWIRVEVARPKDVINNHHSLSLDKDITPRWHPNKGK
jgi:acyl-CoA thioesterase